MIIEHVKENKLRNILLSQFKTSILIDFLTLGIVRERLVTLLLDRSPQKSVKQALVGS